MNFPRTGTQPSEGGHCWCVVVAGGSGTRFGGPKQYLDLGGQRIVDRSLATASRVCDGTVLVVRHSDVATETALQQIATVVVAGGSTRSESVRNGLAAVPQGVDVILIHDAARPLASDDLYRRVIDRVREGEKCVVPVVRPVDTLRFAGGEPLDRDTVRAVQTPQGFDAQTLRQAHSSDAEATDDASLVAACGYEITFVDGERSNLKVTEPVDLVIANALLTHMNNSSPVTEP